MASSDQLRVQGFSGGNNLALTKKLLRSRQEISALRLLGLADHLRKTDRYGAILCLTDELRSASASGFWRVWGTPAAHLWVRLAWELALPAGRRSSLLSKHAAWLGRSVEEFAQEHLPQLGVFTLALHLASGTSYRTSQAVPVGPMGSFPGAGVAWCSGHPLTLLGCTAAGELVVQDKGGERICEISSYACERSPFFRVPEARGRGVIYVDCWDTCSRMDYDGMEWTPRETDYLCVLDASTRLGHALQVIEDYCPEINDEVATVISLAVPLRVLSEAATPSGSVSFLPGLVYFSNVADDCRLAEMLLHEYSHIKLHLLSDCDPLLDPEHHGDGWTKTYYYSPWREDPRPIKGILHGFFVFVEVAAFWASRIESKHYHGSDPIAQQRFKTVFSQLLIACDVLRDHGHFTATGHDLMNELEQRLSAMKPIAASIDGDRIAPIYAEMRGGDPATATSINEAIRRHREQFAREHEV